MNHKTIFIYIASCKEEHLITTIKSAIANAKHKDRLYFGIFNMVIDEFDKIIDPEIIKNDKINYVEVKAEAPLGIGYGRLNSSLLSDRDHDFALQVDAQTIFDKNWDEILIDKFIDLKKIHKKCVISITPNRAVYVNKKYYFGPNFENEGGIEVNPFNFDSNKLTDFNGNILYNSVPWVIKNNKFSNGTIDPRGFFIDGVGPIYKDDLDYIEIPGVDASWMFSDYSMIRNFLHDPHNVFSGDQSNYSLRLISNGYKIFCIKKPLILNVDKWLCGELYHENDWRKTINSNPSRLSKWWDTLSKKYEEDIFTGKYLGYWGAPNKESLNTAKKIMNIEDQYNGD